VRLDVLINGPRRALDPLTTIVPVTRPTTWQGVGWRNSRKLIPRQQIKIPIQASNGSRIMPAKAISAIRKDVLAKSYGGDISRKEENCFREAGQGKEAACKAMGRWKCPRSLHAVLKLNQ